MPKKDIYHSAVRFALIKDGWSILAEDYVLAYGTDRVYADLAAERTIAAERENQQILVEVKSFLGRSFIHDLEQAIGQYILYRDILEETKQNFSLYLAVTSGVYENNFQKNLAQLILKRNQVKLIIVDSTTEVIKKWID